MELDKRIKEGKRPLTCFDLKEAEEYVGKKCYISNEYDFFRDLDFTQQKILNGVEDCETPFHYDSDKQAEFCLPCDWVKEPEKKYRPYSLNENKAMICGYQIMEGEANTPGKGFINLGGIWVSLQRMFDDYETPNSYLYPEVWEPFGVKENEE